MHPVTNQFLLKSITHNISTSHQLSCDKFRFLERLQNGFPYWAQINLLLNKSAGGIPKMKIIKIKIMFQYYQSMLLKLNIQEILKLCILFLYVNES